MSMNLDYEDLWNDLYEWALGHATGTAEIMEEMDPRLAGDGECQDCGGSGFFISEPSCDLSQVIQPNEIVVEKCDSCNHFSDDFSAARSLSATARRVLCADGGEHAVILNSSITN